MNFETLSAVVVGGLISLATSIAYHAWDRRQQRLSLQRMLKSEIQSVFSATERRQYEEKIREIIRQYREGEISEPYYRNFGLENRNILEIYKNNLGKIGLLPKDMASKVVIFYKMLQGVIDDIVEIGDGGGGSPGNRADTLEADLELWQEIKQLGNVLVDNL